MSVLALPSSSYGGAHTLLLPKIFFRFGVAKRLEGECSHRTVIFRYYGSQILLW